MPRAYVDYTRICPACGGKANGIEKVEPHECPVLHATTFWPAEHPTLIFVWDEDEKKYMANQKRKPKKHRKNSR